MKQLFLILLLVVAGVCCDAEANVTIKSETHRAWGVCGDREAGTSKTYDYTAGYAVSGGAYDSDDWYASSSTGLLGVKAGSGASYDPLYAIGNADATWTFEPEWRKLRLEIDVFDLFIEDSLSVEIQDVTVGSQLFGYSGSISDFPDFSTYYRAGGSYVNTFSVDPTHVYRMHLYLESSADLDGPWGGCIRASVVPVPSALMLGGIGAACVGWLRRRKAV